VTRIEALVSDFGGVLTTPLVESFAALQGDSGVSLEAVGLAMARVAQRDGRNPLYELETGRMTERDFLASLGRVLSEDLGREVELHGFGERYFANLHPNEELIAYLRTLRDRGLRLALLTNNVREWEPLWRAKLPVDELFELVIDSAFVGMRKPDPDIYTLTLERLALPAPACLFLDDIDVNVKAARDLGMSAVHFRDTDQAIAEIDDHLSAS
jgi:putative hydrolase of the HAD superfamily